MQVRCGNCQKVYEVGEDWAGKKVKCKACGHSFEVAEQTKPEPQAEDEQEQTEQIRCLDCYYRFFPDPNDGNLAACPRCGTSHVRTKRSTKSDGRLQKGRRVKMPSDNDSMAGLFILEGAMLLTFTAFVGLGTMDGGIEGAIAGVISVITGTFALAMISSGIAAKVLRISEMIANQRIIRNELIMLNEQLDQEDAEGAGVKISREKVG
ncbi:hypothetical protein STSP2_03180 [Anaerohalosphaera lusitana]|uniref:Zinc finger/thioredoxin putative domain-containing protein n=1 Tax=Anaerohalosphaera lusitana TaxID=1936003 RepID=A0A1U9NQT6_9BACT|nr:zinc-ribbon domain-containing protein [Anaerohalosphaera lusitana]AQT69980.1 hypothetical protein STSP2_03180 [Anaerohalosphaera lusitana]